MLIGFIILFQQYGIRKICLYSYICPKYLLKCFVYLAGSFVFIFKMNANIALALAIVPPTVYLILCFKLKSDTQINIAAIMSVLYAFLMAGTILSIIGNFFLSLSIF